MLLLDRRDGPLDTSRGDHSRRATALARWGFWSGCWLRVPSDALERDGLTPTGSILLRYRFPMSRALPVLSYLNHEEIGRVLLDTALESGAASVTGVSEWSLTSSAGQWTIDWQVGGQANSRPAPYWLPRMGLPRLFAAVLR